MSDDVKLLWNKYIHNTHLYRVVSSEHIDSILTHGLRHDKNPFKSKISDIEALFEFVLKLKKKEFIMMRWWDKAVDQERVVQVTRKDLEKSYIDFTSSLAEAREYYKPLSGGALVQTVLIFTEELLLKRIPMTQEELSLVKKLNAWAKKKSTYSNVILKIRGSCRSLESAHLQRFGGQEYIPSPFGSFEHFKNVIDTHGWQTYKPYLEGKLFHLRTVTHIPAKDITRAR